MRTRGEMFRGEQMCYKRGLPNDACAVSRRRMQGGFGNRRSGMSTIGCYLWEKRLIDETTKSGPTLSHVCTLAGFEVHINAKIKL
jgi:hypothetical protein